MHQKLKSSAKGLDDIGYDIGYDIVSFMSFMTNTNNVTEIDDPCGTPFSWTNVFERVFEILTMNILDDR